MVLESLTNDENINIKDLVLEEESTSETIYDLEKVITDEVWQKMISYLESLDIHGAWNYLQPASQLKLLDPVRLSSYQFSDEVWQSELNYIGRRNPPIQSITDAGSESIAFAKILFPEKAHQLYSPDEAERAKSQIFSNESVPKGHYIHCLPTYRILFPDRDLKSDFNLTAEDFSSFNDYISSGLSNDLVNAASLASELKVGFPDLNVIGLFSKENQRKLYLELTTFRDQSKWREFLKLALAIKCLISKDIKITDEGIEFIKSDKPESFQPENLPLPNRRSF